MPEYAYRYAVPKICTLSIKSAVMGFMALRMRLFQIVPASLLMPKAYMVGWLPTWVMAALLPQFMMVKA